jgi:hypothetical protein
LKTRAATALVATAVAVLGVGTPATSASRSHPAAALVGLTTLSAGAVEKHVNGIFTKLDLPQEAGTNRRVLAVLRYLQQ